MACSGCNRDKTNETACECPNPGFCKRHDMQKGPHLHRLCQTRMDYFQMWEDGHGPGQGVAQQGTKSKPQTLQEVKEQTQNTEQESQPVTSQNIDDNAVVQDEAEAEEPRQMPNMAKQAWNFTRAGADHLKSGAAHASEKLYKARMEQCDGCDRRQDTRCLECGCYLPTKAKWASSECPIGKWPKEEDLQ